MSVYSYLYILDKKTGKQIEGNPGEDSSQLATTDGKKTNNLIRVMSSNFSIRNSSDRAGSQQSAPIKSEVTLTILWDNSMTYLFNSLYHAHELDCKLYFYGKGIDKPNVDSQLHNWFTVELDDARLSMTDLYKPHAAGSMEEEVITISLSYRKIKIIDHDMENTTAGWDWAKKRG